MYKLQIVNHDRPHPLTTPTNHTHQVFYVGFEDDVYPEVQERVAIDGHLPHHTQLVIQCLGSCHNGVHFVCRVGGEVGSSMWGRDRKRERGKDEGRECGEEGRKEGRERQREKEREGEEINF